MNKNFLLLLSTFGIIVLIPGCRRTAKAPVKPQTHVIERMDIPVASHEVKTYFDEDIDELAFADQPFVAVPLETDDARYAWLDQKDAQFKKIYFDFDKYTIKPSERDAAAYDVSKMKELLAKEEQAGKKIQFVINGNADDAAGSDAYNRLLSEKRAKTFKDFAIASGIPADSIKIIGRGSDIPEIINGKVCKGDKDQQAPNRRDEIQLVYIAPVA